VEQEAKLVNQINELETENKSLKENHNENAEIVEELSRVRVESYDFFVFKQ
jgi:hypothetical protein